MHPVIEWKEGKVLMLDQRLLPMEEIYVEHLDHHQVADSIRNMVIRGAPAIGVAAAMGIALGMDRMFREEPEVFNDAGELDIRFGQICDEIGSTRPTAVNLFWAVNRMRTVYDHFREKQAVLCENLIKEACDMDIEDVEINRRIGANGEDLLKNGDSVLTHCNAGALATSGYGTALGVIRAAVEAGKKVTVFADETRPYLQGARLTVWELQRDSIPVTLITDNMAGFVMAKGMVQAVIVGADRIAANGDTANKIGTYSLAILARHHGIPFYVAAPLSTIDRTIDSGAGIPIEERNKKEVLQFQGTSTASPHTSVYNPAFDITPAELIHSIITEKERITPPFGPAIRALFT